MSITQTEKPDWGVLAQTAAEAHLKAQWEYHSARQEITGDEPDGVALLEALGDPPEGGGPFCGCPTCEVRETLWAAMPIIAEAILVGDVDPKDMLTQEQRTRLLPQPKTEENHDQHD